MSHVAIKVENLGKKYFIRHEKQESYKTFQDVLINSGKKIITSLNPFDKASATEDKTTEEFWALKDVNFEINKGDKVGIIGRNGAGKSTLLKVLSRITEPTTGKIHINGRIASLLEVGTGFHPELTGRENIYLNGAILGMSRKEIKRKFDEIVAFAEVEKFLDTPVKRYSSGMYVRLAFSVAAHLEPEILVVDEVLAVGDAAFQKKSLGKMNEISEEGRTILFVSHNMGAINQLTNKAILLEQGNLSFYDKTHLTVDRYMQNKLDYNRVDTLKTNHQSFEIVSLKYCDTLEKSFNIPLTFELILNLHEHFDNVYIALGIYNSLGTRILTSKNVFNLIQKGKNRLLLTVHDHHLPPGHYALSLGLSQAANQIFFSENILSFEIDQSGITDPLLIPYLSSHFDKIGAFYHLNIRYESL